MNGKKIILLDIDEVLNNLKEKWFEVYNKKYNDTVRYINITEWDVTKFVKPEAKEDIIELLKTPGLFSEMVTPPEGAIEATEVLSKYYDIYLVTHCKFCENYCEKVEYIEKHFPHIPIENFISCKNKSLIKGDFIVDDYYENMRDFDGVKILMSREHNLFDNTIPNEGLYRVSNWDDILNLFALDNDNVMQYVTEKYNKESLN